MLTHNTRLAENKDFYLPKIKKYIYAWSISVIILIIIIIIIIILCHRELSQMLSIKFLLLLLKIIIKVYLRFNLKVYLNLVYLVGAGLQYVRIRLVIFTTVFAYAKRVLRKGWRFEAILHSLLHSIRCKQKAVDRWLADLHVTLLSV